MSRSRSMIRRSVAAGVFGGVLLLGAGTAHAQAYPPGPEDISGPVELNDTTFAAGETVTLTVSNIPPGEEVTFTLFSTPKVLGTAVANSAGVATGTFKISNVPAGAHTIVASYENAAGETVYYATPVTVAAAPTTTSDDTLPNTGANSTTFALVGGAAVVGGTALFVAGKRRKAA